MWNPFSVLWYSPLTRVCFFKDALCRLQEFCHPASLGNFKRLQSHLNTKSGVKAISVHHLVRNRAFCKTPVFDFLLRSMIEQKREDPSLISVYILPCYWASPKPWCPNPKNRGVLRTLQLTVLMGWVWGQPLESRPGCCILPHLWGLHCPTKALMHLGVMFCLCRCSTWVVLPALTSLRFWPPNTSHDNIYGVAVETFSLTKQLLLLKNYPMWCPVTGYQLKVTKTE